MSETNSKMTAEELAKQISLAMFGELYTSKNLGEIKELITAYTAPLTAEVERLRELVVKGYDVVQDFMPNIGRCALQDYQALNEFTFEGGKIKAALDGKGGE